MLQLLILQPIDDMEQRRVDTKMVHSLLHLWRELVLPLPARVDSASCTLVW